MALPLSLNRVSQPVPWNADSLTPHSIERSSMSIAEEIKKLDQLRQSGILTDDEFRKTKVRLLNSVGAASNDPFDKLLNSVGLGSGTNVDERRQNYAMWLHFSMLANMATLGAGYVIPIVMWQTHKEDPIIDQHGRNAINFLICQLILVVIGGLLSAVSYMIFVILGLGALFMSIVCPILVGLKAKQGIVEKYPLTYPIFKA